MFVIKPWHRVILMVALAGMTISALAWVVRRDSAISFLPRDRRAEWIVFPAAMDANAHWLFAGIDATFRRELTLIDRPSTARLGICAMRRAEVRINGTRVSFPPNSNCCAAASPAGTVIEEFAIGFELRCRSIKLPL